MYPKVIELLISIGYLLKLLTSCYLNSAHYCNLRNFFKHNILIVGLFLHVLTNHFVTRAHSNIIMQFNRKSSPCVCSPTQHSIVYLLKLLNIINSAHNVCNFFKHNHDSICRIILTCTYKPFHYKSPFQ